MKKTILFLIVLLIFTIPANANSINDSIQIRMFLRNYNKALDNHNIEQIRSFYDENYKNADGFLVDDIIQMFEKTYNAYGKMKQKTKINSITSFDDYTIVQLTDTTSATVYPDKNKTKEKSGKLSGKSLYTLYLKKYNNSWKIFYDEIIAETTSLKYGVANKIPMELKTPMVIKNGEQYDLSLKMDKPDNIIALASLSNEKIEFPSSKYNEKFRKYPSEGELERLVKANNDNKNEYAVASVGFTKFSINEEATKARIEIIGMAYLMKRINMVNLKENNAK